MAKAADVSTPSSFLTQLLAPVAGSVEHVSDIKFLRELRRDMERRWRLACHRLYAARAYREYRAHERIIAEIEQRRLASSEAAAETHAHLQMFAAVNHLMQVPAPDLKALRQKQKLRRFSNGRERWETAIAADEVRLR